jgi:hypothetical protein
MRRAGALTIFFRDFLHDFDLKIALGQKLLEPGILMGNRLTV